MRRAAQILVIDSLLSQFHVTSAGAPVLRVHANANSNLPGPRRSRVLPTTRMAME